MKEKKNKDIESMEIIVRDSTAVAPPTTETFEKWVKARVVDDAPELYGLLTRAIKTNLESDAPSIKVMELTAEIMGIRANSGISIINNNNNVSGGVTVNNGGITLEDIIKRNAKRRSDERDTSPKVDKVEFIDAEEV